MLEVKIEKILPITEARDSFNKLIDEVEGTDELYVFTKNGKPAAVLVGVHHLEKLTGTSKEELMDQTTMPASNDDSGAPMTPTDSATDNSQKPEESATMSPEIKIDPSATEALPEKEPEKPTFGEEVPLGSESTQTPVSTPDVTTTQQSGATASPLETPAASTSTDNTPVEDPLDFLSDSDADPIPATPEVPAVTTNLAMSTPPAMPAGDPMQAPAATGPSPMPSPETPAQIRHFQLKHSNKLVELSK